MVRIMTERNFTLSHVEASFVVAALWHQLNGGQAQYDERDREVMTAVMIRLAAGLDLDDEVRKMIDR